MYVRTLDPIAQLPLGTRRRLWGHAFRRKLDRDEFLLHGGDDSAGRLHLLRRGAVSIMGRDARGKEAAIDVCGPGELLGVAALLGEPGPCDARALIETIVYSFPGAPTIDALLSTPDAARVLLGQVVRSHVRASSSAIERSTGSASARIAGRLLELVRTCGDGSSSAPHLLQSRLGELAGVSREHACREMGKLRRAGVIDYGRSGLRVHRPDVLERLRCGERDVGSSRSEAAGGHRRSRHPKGI